MPSMQTLPLTGSLSQLGESDTKKDVLGQGLTLLNESPPLGPMEITNLFPCGFLVFLPPYQGPWKPSLKQGRQRLGSPPQKAGALSVLGALQAVLQGLGTKY